MSKWMIEMTYTVGVSLDDIEADTEEEAIEKAKEIAESDAHWHMDVDEAQFEQVTYINKK